MNNTVTDVTPMKPFTHAEAMSLLVVEFDRTIDLLGSLDEAEWAMQTDCPDWNVLQMYQHVLGACGAGASMKENMHQMRAARSHRKANGGPLEAALSAVQIRDRADLSPTDVVERLAAIAPDTVRGRTRTPALMRRMKMKIDGPVSERWSLGYLIDTIYLRDLWMHRVDVAHVTGRELVLTSEHDGRIVADVVAEWSRRHGEPVNATLDGPAGGAYSANEATATTESVELDAVEFCRILAGRAEATGLLETIVPF